MHDEQLRTGIIVSDDDTLVLRPFPLLFRRRALIRFAAAGIVIACAAALAFAALFRAHVSWTTALAVALIASILFAWRMSTEVTYVVRRSSVGIVVETRNRILRTRLRRLLHRFSDITAVELRSRVNPNVLRPGVSPMGAYLHYDIILCKGSRRTLFWYTRYPECAIEIARRVARDASVPLVDVDDVHAAAV